MSKHEKRTTKEHLTEQLAKYTQFDKKIWPVYVILQPKHFIKISYKKFDLETSSRSLCVYTVLSITSTVK